MVFKLAYFVEVKIGYQSAKFECCRLSGSSFTEGLQKRNDDVISCCWDSNFAYFVKLDMDYQPAKFQIFRFSGSNFTEVFIRQPKYHYGVIT